MLTPDMVLGAPRAAACRSPIRRIPVLFRSLPNMPKDNDLFICEGMYGEKEKTAKAREYKHMTFQEAAGLGQEANPREMWLTHYSPSLMKPEEYLDEIREIFPQDQNCPRRLVSLELGL